MEMKCPKCGAPVNIQADTGSAFCEECGFEVQAKQEKDLSEAGQENTVGIPGLRDDFAQYNKFEDDFRKEFDAAVRKKKSSRFLIGLISGLLIISAALGGYFWYRKHSASSNTRPVVSKPVTQQSVVSTPVKIPAKSKKTAVTAKTPVKPPVSRTIQKPKPKPRRAHKATVTHRHKVVRRKVVVQKSALEQQEVIPAKPDINEITTNMQSWLTARHYNVKAAVKNGEVVLEGSARPAEKVKIITKMKSYDVNYRDLIFPDIN